MAGLTLFLIKFSPVLNKLVRKFKEVTVKVGVSVWVA